MSSQVANVYPQFEASIEAETQLSNLFQSYEIDYPANSLMSNVYVQYELLVSPLDLQGRIANFVLQYELQALAQTPEFGPRLSSET